MPVNEKSKKIIASVNDLDNLIPIFPDSLAPAKKTQKTLHQKKT
jgi:hypothetical protein